MHGPFRMALFGLKTAIPFGHPSVYTVESSTHQAATIRVGGGSQSDVLRFAWLQATDAKLERRKNYCALAVALIEDLPMGVSFRCSMMCRSAAASWMAPKPSRNRAGTLNVVYLLNSISECVDSKCRWSEESTCSSIGRDCICDLDGSFIQIALLLLSALTSAAMFAFKISTLEVIKHSLDMDVFLTQQQSELTAELQALLSPQEFRRVSRVLRQHDPRQRLSLLGGVRQVAPEIQVRRSGLCMRPRCM